LRTGEAIRVRDAAGALVKKGRRNPRVLKGRLDFLPHRVATPACNCRTQQQQGDNNQHCIHGDVSVPPRRLNGLRAGDVPCPKKLIIKL
jgi:hypothetical protein